MKKYNKEYIEKADKLIWEILEDKREFSDYTQIGLSIQNAVQAAADIWGLGSDEQIHKMAGFVREVIYTEIDNTEKLDIEYRKKEEYVIKFADERYLQRVHCNNKLRKCIITKTKNIYDALPFNEYSKAEKLRTDLISIVCNERCEIILKP